MSRIATTRNGTHAVVIGASMAGLVAARALSDTYDTVTLLDRDRLPAEPAQRRGVPQGRHAHGIQPGGLLALEELFPGLRAELLAAGACPGDTLANGAWFVGGGWLARGDARTTALGVSRPLLEHLVREQVRRRPGITIRDGVDVDGVLSTPGRDQVTGVLLRDGTRLAADLVVDASGRASRLPDWLTELGYAVPAEEQVHCRMSYLTRRWQLAGDGLGDDVVLIITPAATPEFCALIAQEDGSHILTLGSLLDGGPDSTDEAYRAFAAALPGGRLGDALAGATPLDDLRSAHFPYSRRRRYDRLSRFPAGLLAIGDSIASFNPMYGQGMTVAALEAVALRAELAAGTDGLARRFFKAAHRIEDVAWQMSTGGDLRFASVQGRRPPQLALLNRYLDRLARHAHTDPVLGVAFLRVAAFLDGPPSLLTPRIALRVLGPRRRPRVVPARGRVWAESGAV